MHVKIYSNPAYTSGLTLYSNNLSVQTFALTDTTVDGVTYRHTSTVSMSPEAADTVLLDSANANVYNTTYYIKPSMTLHVTACEVVPSANPPANWSARCTFALYVSGTEILSSGLSIEYTFDAKPKMQLVFTSCMIGGSQYFGFMARCRYSIGGMETEGNTGGLVSQNFFDGSLAPRYDNGQSASDPNAGYGDNDILSDNTETVGTPDGIGAATHGLRVYELPLDSLDKLYEKLFSWNPVVVTERWISSMRSAIVSIHKMPDVSSSVWSDVNSVKFGGIFEIPLTAKRVLPTIEPVETPEISIGTVQGDFLDYTNTAASIYLPFCGEFAVNIQDIMSGSLSVKYLFDYVQGNCVANVYSTSGDGVRKLVGSYSGNAAYKLPVMGDDSTGSLGVIATVACVGAAIAVGSPGVAVGAMKGATTAGLLGTAAANLQTSAPKVYASGAVGANSAYYSDMTLAVHLYRPKAIYPETYAHAVGRPAADHKTVGSYTGFLAGTVHADISGATDDEKSRIESWIERGIIV